MSAIADDHLPELALEQLPADDAEFLSVPPDGASLDGSSPTPGLPLETAARPDVEPGLTESHRWQIDLAPELGAAALQHISGDGLRLIESFEGYSGVRYLDSVGVPTLGYGTTGADIWPLPGACSRAQAEGWLRSKMASKYEPAVRSTGAPLNVHQFDALCSFAYNLGPGSMSDSWSIGHLLRQRNYRAAADSLLNYDHAGGVRLLGLTRRRQAERALFLEPVPPPDPHHLARYPANAWVLDGRKIPERGTMEEWFRLLPHMHSAVNRMHQLQRDIVLLRKRVWSVAHWEKPTSWAPAWRWWRWQDLLAQSRVHIG